jgi:protease YdgD
LHVLGALLACTVAFAAVTARAEQPLAGTLQNPMQRHGIGETDPRIRIDLREEPWRALGKLQATVGERRTTCTGALVGPRTALTAAHCLVNPKTGAYHLASALHFLVGFDRGSYAIHARVLQFAASPGYDPARISETIGSDWALLTLDLMHGTDERILPMRSTVPPKGTPVMIGGYSQDNPLVVTADIECRIVGHVRDRSGKLLLKHDCAATRGTSGAPLLIQDGAGWSIGGVNVAAPRGEAGGFAVTVDEPRRQP